MQFGASILCSRCGTIKTWGSPADEEASKVPPAEGNNPEPEKAIKNPYKHH
jgi:hypothetical protein